MCRVYVGVCIGQDIYYDYVMWMFMMNCITLGNGNTQSYSV